MESDGERPAVWVPVSKIAAEMADAADRWRRKRGIRLEDWPPWM
jgi:hypothetical protein